METIPQGPFGLEFQTEPVIKNASAVSVCERGSLRTAELATAKGNLTCQRSHLSGLWDSEEEYGSWGNLDLIVSADYPVAALRTCRWLEFHQSSFPAFRCAELSPVTLASTVPLNGPLVSARRGH